MNAHRFGGDGAAVAEIESVATERDSSFDQFCGDWSWLRIISLILAAFSKWLSLCVIIHQTAASISSSVNVP